VAALLLAFLAVLPGQANAATFTVNTIADELNADGDCSLREAIEAANTNAAADACAAGDAAPTVDVINFSVIGTITLTSGQLTVADDLNIGGPGAANLTISGDNSTRVMEVSTGTTLDLKDVTVANGSAPDGGGILAGDGMLTLTNSTLSGNFAANNGGAIHNIGSGSLTLTNTTLSGNSAASHGGVPMTPHA
jgi:CSLREA domain-containing protein